jgi:hypothetical protein
MSFGLSVVGSGRRGSRGPSRAVCGGARGAVHVGRWTSGYRSRVAGRRRARGFVDPFQLVIGDRDVMLAHSQEAADPQNDVSTLPDLPRMTSLMSPIFSLASL